jgi:hypothetical protein
MGALKSDFRDVIKNIDLDKASTVYALSDGHVYVNGNSEDIAKIAFDKNLEIHTFKGPELLPSDTKIKTDKKLKEEDGTI